MNNLKRTLLLICCLLLAAASSACTEGATAEERVEPAIVEPIDGTEFNRITLTSRAAERLDVQTAEVREVEVNGSMRLVVPYAAILYDINGGTWLYTSPAPLTYVRAAIAIDYIDGDDVYLFEGPPTGTEVVTVAVAELYGTDTGVGK